MTIIDGKTPEEWELAVRLVKNNPHPAHLEENRIMIPGHSWTVEIDFSIAHSEIVASAIREDEAFIAGITHPEKELGGDRIVWMLASAGATNWPRWYYRQAKNMLDLANKHYGKGTKYRQYIPMSYREGLNFVLHLGFKVTRYGQAPDGSVAAEVIRRV